MSTTMAARPNVAAAEFSYMEMMFPDTLDPESVSFGKDYHRTCTP